MLFRSHLRDLLGFGNERLLGMPIEHLLHADDRGAEAKLQRVIKAYKTLKKAGMAN